MNSSGFRVIVKNNGTIYEEDLWVFMAYYKIIDPRVLGKKFQKQGLKKPQSSAKE